MKTSEQGLALIEQEEGFRSFPYLDVVGKSTVGYGHLIKPGEDFSKGITKDQAIDLLHLDIVHAEEIVNKEVTVPLTQGEYDALVDFCYNLGDRLKGSTLLRLLNAGNYDAARMHLADWDLAGGQPNKGLKARRLLEMQIWAKGDLG